MNYDFYKKSIYRSGFHQDKGFSEANKLTNEKIFNIFLVSGKKEYITTQNGITVRVDCYIEDLKDVDILVIPGGRGAVFDSVHDNICKYIIKEHSSLQYLLTVCTGAIILARAGLLHGKVVTTHKNLFDLLKRIDDSVTISSSSNVIVDGNFAITAGILTGIEGALRILKGVCGSELMERVKDNLYY